MAASNKQSDGSWCFDGLKKENKWIRKIVFLCLTLWPQLSIKKCIKMNQHWAANIYINQYIYIYMSLNGFLMHYFCYSTQRCCTVCLTKSNSGVHEEASPHCFVTISPVQVVCLGTNLLAQAFCENGNCFAWQGISLERNNGSSCEIWQQGLTFGSMCLLPRLFT